MPKQSQWSTPRVQLRSDGPLPSKSPAADLSDDELEQELVRRRAAAENRRSIASSSYTTDATEINPVPAATATSASRAIRR